MSRRWNRREMLQSLSVGAIAGSNVFAATAKAAAAAPLARCTVWNDRGEPLPVEEFARFHTCDLLQRPFTIDPHFEPGTAAFQSPPRPFRIVNSTGTWSDYYMGRHSTPWQQGVYDYMQAVNDAGAEYECVGLQYYHSGRDLLEFESNLDIFKRFGKPIQISELEISSTSDDPGKSEWFGGGLGGAKFVWRGEPLSEEIQAQWVEAVYKILFSKPYVDAVTWWDFSDPAFFPGGGYLRADLTPKPSFERLLALQTKWRQEGLLHDFRARTVVRG